ncbi:MAG: 2-oxoacid:acceptor oxidoreductase subunit alpha [Candidatus Omnitrophica bacterium]|nr:2-oxoacid:acceptor oxidoreductase subunit alpha [Candidatus Omnitrophota bacterium]
MERCELTIKISGEAGQGMQTIGMALCKLFKDAGFSIFANQDYMSRVRGGNNFFQLRVSHQPQYTLRQNSDILIALDKQSISLQKKNLSPSSVIIFDKQKFAIEEEGKNLFNAPLYDLALKNGESEIFVNSVACGLLTRMGGLDFVQLEKVLRSVFGNKGVEVVDKNIKSAQAGFDYAKNNFTSNKFNLPKATPREKLLLNGNEAIALGAIAAGVKFYSAYPMTPSTSIMDTVAHYAKNFNILVEQAEDEIAAINMAIGASFTGARAMTATSGGGFCLMTEGLSLAGMTETPVVIVDAQRPAPATGFPTRTEQADLGFLLHAGHGEFARVVFTPGSIEEAFYLTIKAFDLAEKYQIPALIMTDQHLADSYREIGPEELKASKVKRYIISKQDSGGITDYKRYKLTSSGISPQAVPSWINGLIYADSDEHTEEGHITEDAQVRVKMVEKRFHKKMLMLEQEIEGPKFFNLRGAKICLVGFGSTFGVLKEAVLTLKDEKVGFVHLPQVWPFPAAALQKLLKGARKIFTVENNAGAQLARLLRRETGIEADKSILKYDGRPFNVDYLVAQLKKR